jgi:hypothetical protein
VAWIHKEFEEGSSRELDCDTRLLFRPGLQKVLQEYKEGPKMAWLMRVKMVREQAAVRQGEMDIGG